MKKILTMLISVFASVFSSVPYQAQDNVQYKSDGYYKIEDTEPPSYRDSYETGFGVSDSQCSPRAFKKQPRKVLNDKNVSTTLYWLVNGTAGVKISDLPQDLTYTFDADAVICAPYRCILESSSTTDSDSCDMVLICKLSDDENAKQYQLEFKNMERWWCDFNRTVDNHNANGYPVWKHTCKEQRGKTFDGGYTLGKSIANVTELHITESGNEVSLQDFYTSLNEQLTQTK